MVATPPPLPDAVQEQHRFPCENCGAACRFSAETGALVCDHCGHTQQITQPGPWKATIRELDFRRAAANDLAGTEMEESRVATCPNCAAQVDFDPAVHAAECPFCATPLVVDTGASRHIKPRGLLPFAIGERAARKAMQDWLGGLWFAPNGLQQYARKGRKMNGVYVPYWTYDADTRTRYTGQRGTIYYETRTVTRNGKTVTEQVQRIRWTPVAGRVARAFDDVLVLASTSLPTHHAEALAPWDLAELVPYNPEYLAGFRAESYTISLEDGFTEAREVMDRTIARDVRFDIGGDRQRITSADTDVSAVTFKHILLPIWLAAYKYRGTSYRFVVNGRTGRVEGERPWSGWKIAFAVLAGLIVAAGLGYLYAMNQ